MTLGMTLVYPVQIVGSGDMAHMAPTVRLPDVLLCRFFCLHFATVVFWYFAAGGQIQQTAKQDAAVREFYVKK